MITRVELKRDGTKRVYHRSSAGSAWTHETNRHCDVCDRVLASVVRRERSDDTQLVGK